MSTYLKLLKHLLINIKFPKTCKWILNNNKNQINGPKLRHMV